jgi:mono/diheme cytochrome c family protein/cytochrome c553
MALVAVLLSSAFAQEDDEDSPYRPGLIATYTATDRSIIRVDETIAFDWKDAVCDPRLPAGNFSASWRGRLWARGAGSYRLLCYAHGEVEIKLAGKTVVSGKAEQPQWLTSQPLNLEFDYHPVEIAFRKTGAAAQLALFWSGPDFRLEPIPARALLHDRTQSPSASFERGRQLAAALRCAACHRDSAASVLPAPALDRLSGNIHQAWLIDWLTQHTQARSASEGSRGAGVPPATSTRSVSDESSLRRMPDLGMTRDEAEAVAAWLLRQPAEIQKAKEQKGTKVTKSETKKSDAKSGKKGKAEERPKPSAEQGEHIVLTRGCLACHQLGELGESGLFGGGDLTALTSKRPADFLTRWLENPSAVNRQHRMPVFTFTADELASLALWAKEQVSYKPEAQARDQRPDRELIGQGEKLVASFRCATCHALTSDSDKRAAPPLKELTAASDWSKSCAGEPDKSKLRPGYHLANDDQTVLKDYFSQPRPGQEQLSPQAHGRDLLVELNCLACHQREGAERFGLPALQEKLVAVAEAHADLAPLVPAMTPPALNSVGDKLLDSALSDAISRQGPPHRPYLLVQMPKFDLTKDQLDSLVAYFTATDRIPKSSPVGPRLDGSGKAATTPVRASGDSGTESPTLAALAAAGPRLVTTDGLACTSCHQVGSVEPSKAPLNARGPDMSMLGKRIRREWFDRWCDNPARIVPRMEMPAVKIPVRGVLNDKIDDQLAAVWHILNTPGFEPPEPNPVRVLRLSGLAERNERPIVIHDVVKDGDKTYLFPLVIGLPNRHNILFDLETNRLAAWWLGDTARQRTKGKSWWWEMGGRSLLSDDGGFGFELSMVINGEKWVPLRKGQFAVDLASYSEAGIGYWQPMHRLSANNTEEDFPLGVIHRFMLISDAAKSGILRGDMASLKNGFCHVIHINGGDPIPEFTLKLLNPDSSSRHTWHEQTNTLQLEGTSSVRLTFGPARERAPQPKWNGDGSIRFRGYTPLSTIGGWRADVAIVYSTSLSPDTFETASPPPTDVPTMGLQVAPGLEGTRLPLNADVMPSGFAWNAKGELYFCTLKGQTFCVSDRNGDGIEDGLTCIADGLPTPYGIEIDSNQTPLVATKAGLVRLVEDERQKRTARQIAASGWGHTDDYHDWAVGPIRGDNGEYYIALPCQQDQRSDLAARYRGKILKLVPRKLTYDEEPQQYDIEIISSGHRFPMGMARNREGELFVTDNQGNYNPFNELNHVRKDSHFGFINALEKQNGFKPPPLEEPAINIPHPWTRSVNGICFLETPSDLRPLTSDLGSRRSLYGPLEGHLVGCEYDTRRLIRMSLQKIGDTYQGCAYPLSIPPADVEKGLLGPIVCAIKPTTGELYVGEIRDSGWGAGNNIGQIVKIKIEPEKFPCGIAEVRATKTGFTIDFFQPVDRVKAADIASYSISSYRRESTPAYGGPDLDRRDEKISTAELSADAKRVTLTLPELRTSHVYEIRLKNLTPGGGLFHPDEAHYTLRQIP